MSDGLIIILAFTAMCVIALIMLVMALRRLSRRRGVNPEWTSDDFTKARPAREVLGDDFVDAWEKERKDRVGP